MILRSLPFRAAFATGIALFAASALAQNSGKTQSSAPQSPYQGTVVEEIVARVNDQIISKSEFARAEQELEAQGRQQGWTQQQLFDQRHNLLRDLIDQQLLLSRGKELGITGETEVVRRLDDIRKQNHLDSMDDLQKAVESQGLSFEDFKQHIREGIISSQVIRDEVGRHLNLTQTEVQQYYNAHKDQFSSPEQVTLSEILIPTADPDNASQVATAQAKANDVVEKLKSGGDFAALAKTESGGPTAAQGGELGDFHRGQLAKVLEDQTFDLKPGEYTQPIRTKQGFVILKVTAHNPGGVQPLKDVESQVEDAIYNQKMAPALRQYLTKLREDASIDLKEGYEDSAATPNETHPTLTYSAYVPPSGKKKKHVQRTQFRQKGHREKPEPEAASAPAAPAGVPSLAQVAHGDSDQKAAAPATTANGAEAAGNKPSAPTASAKPTQTANLTGIEKPGKKEKIRFGQAPRETLPAADTKEEDAGAAGSSAGTQDVASNVPQNGSLVQNPDGTLSDEQPEEKKDKTRFASRAKLPKDKKAKAKKVDPFAPPEETTDELATRKAQSAPLGLNGDTTTPKKAPKPTEKTRLSDKAKEAQPADTTQQTPSAPAPAAPQQ